ncbi:hypothetical protein BDR26DRAFT_856070 [Obelidium mucronatum]|nr:hypothetical protein BDR26DRAFT_856070 [Obelidium mucronatum]
MKKTPSAPQSLKQSNISLGFSLAEMPQGPRLRKVAPVASVGNSRTNIFEQTKFRARMLEIVRKLDKWHMKPNVIFAVYCFQAVSSLISVISAIVLVQLMETSTARQNGMPGTILMLLQFTESLVYSLYRSGRLKCFSKVTESQAAYIGFWYLMAGFFNTLIIALLFVLKQNNVYTIIYECCNGTSITTSTCYGNVQANNITYEPATCTAGSSWLIEYKQNLYLSVIYACFCGYQALSHHWNTSEVVVSIKSGLIFRKERKGKVVNFGGSEKMQIHRTSVDKRVHPRPSRNELAMEELQEEEDAP